MSNSGEVAGPPDAPPPDRESAETPPLRLVLVRHARSTWNEGSRIQGQLDPPLSESGREQARLLGERLRGWQPDAFYSSDLARCRETAGAVAETIGCVPELVPELREIALGEWEGLTRDEIIARYPGLWERWVRDPDWDVVPGGERAAEFEHRVHGALAKIRAAHPSGVVLVVTHGGVIQVALGQALNWDGSRGLFPFRIGNTSVNVIETAGSRTTVVRVNDVSHLPRPIPV